MQKNCEKYVIIFLQTFVKFESFRFHHANDITTWLKCATTPSFCVKYNYACWMPSPLGQCIPKWHKCWNMNGNNVRYTIHMVHVWHKIIHNSSSSRKEKISLTFVEIVENWAQVSTIELFLQIHNVGVLCMLIPQLLKFWKINFEVVEPCVFK